MLREAVQHTFHVFKQNFIYPKPLNTGLPLDGSSRRCMSFTAAPLKDRKKEALFSAFQIALSILIFSLTFTEKDAGFNGPELNRISDEFTLWTNTLLFCNGLTSLILGEKERINRVNHQVQAALLPGTIFLGLSMKLGTTFFGLDDSKESFSVPVVVIQHVPSVLVAYIAARIHNMRTSASFKLPSLLFFLFRLAFSAQYFLRDLFQHFAGYPEFDFKQNNVFNPKEFAFMVCALTVNVFLANVITFSLWKGGENLSAYVLAKSKEKLAHCSGTLFCGNGNSQSAGDTVPMVQATPRDPTMTLLDFHSRF